MSGDSRHQGLDLDAIHARVDALSNDNWSGYADDLGDGGRCELFAGPLDGGYRTGAVFAVREDCNCGCYPPSPAEMRFIEAARRDTPDLLTEVHRLDTALDTARRDAMNVAQAAIDLFREYRDVHGYPDENQAAAKALVDLREGILATDDIPAPARAGRDGYDVGSRHAGRLARDGLSSRHPAREEPPTYSSDTRQPSSPGID